MINKKIDNLDERQLKKRNSIACISFYLLLIAVLANGILKLFINEWAEPLAEASSVLFIPCLYFIVSAMYNNVYFGNRQNIKRIIILDIIVLGQQILNISIGVNGKTIDIKDGKLINNFSRIPIIIMMIALLLTYFIRRQIDKKTLTD